MEGTDNVTLKGRLATRRGALLDRKPILLPVPGYDDLLRVKYRPLDYRTVRRIGMRQQSNPDQVESEINVAADSLVTACVGLYGVPPGWDGNAESLVDTGHQWGVQAARELFGIGQDELPEGSTGRDALLRIIPDETDVVLHYAEFDRRAREVNSEVSEELSGESEAGSAQA